MTQVRAPHAPGRLDPARTVRRHPVPWFGKVAKALSGTWRRPPGAAPLWRLPCSFRGPKSSPTNFAIRIC